jgi:predicted metal-dependent hydrolase
VSLREWLRRPPAEPATITVAGRSLPVVVRPLRHARRMTLRLAPDGSEARVSMPAWGRAADAIAFARTRVDWLAGQLARLPEVRSLAAGDRFCWRGQPVTIEWRQSHPRAPRLEAGVLRVGGPEQGLEKRVRRWLEAEARSLLTDDLADYAARAGVPPPPLSLANARRRWGSCSATGAIRINWRLVMAPDFVRRSVVAHEVAHLLHFDHSPAFYHALDRLFEGDIAAANRWLRREGRGLHAVFA